MPTAMYSIYATVGLHVTVPRMPVLQLYESSTAARGSAEILFVCTVVYSKVPTVFAYHSGESINEMVNDFT